MHAHARKLLSLLILAPLLSACATGNFNPQAVTPDVVPYSREFQAKAADELERMPPPCAADVANEHCSAVHRLVIDYGTMRNQARAIASGA